jgi:hypothetical protein
MSFPIDYDSINLSDDSIDTITIPSGAVGSSEDPGLVFSISGNTISGATIAGSSGLHWGMNGTSASPSPSISQVYTTNGTSTGWANITLAEPDIKGATLKVNGNAEFEGEVKIGGKNIADMFEKIEERLAILHPHPELEDRWDELKELGKRYKELEQELLEKEKVWAILKR